MPISLGIRSPRMAASKQIFRCQHSSFVPQRQWHHLVQGSRGSHLRGELCGQMLLTENGLRRFGGHTPRVSGSRFYSAIGLETNKIRILARHSGDTILRYIQEAPLKSIRVDLGMAAQGRASKAASSSSAAASVHTSKQVSVLEAKIEELERALQVHAQELTTLYEAAKKGVATSYI